MPQINKILTLYSQSSIMIQQFESVLLRRTSSKPLSAVRSKLRVSSNPFLNSARLNHSFLQSSFLEKLKPKPLKRKNTLQKFHELRKRMATKANQRIRKMTVNAVTAELKEIQKKEFVEKVDANGILCNKAIVHVDKQKQEMSWKAGLIASNDRLKYKSRSRSKLGMRIKTEAGNDDVDQDGRKFSQDIQEKKIKFSYLRRKVDTTFISMLGDESLFNSQSTAKSGLNSSAGWRKASEEVKGEKVVNPNLRETSRTFFGKSGMQKMEPWKTHKQYMESQEFEVI